MPTEKVTINTLPIHFDKVLTGSHGGDSLPHIDIPRIIRLSQAGRLSFDGIITHEFPLAEINTAIDVVRSGTAGRVLLNCCEGHNPRWKAGHATVTTFQMDQTLELCFAQCWFEELCYAEPGTRFDNESLQR